VSRAALVAFLAGALASLATADLAALVLAGAGRTRIGTVAAGVLAPLRGGAATPADRRRLAALAACALLLAGWALSGPLLGVVLAAAGPVAAGQALAAARRRRAGRLAAGAPALARAVADALAGGHSIRGAIVEAQRGGVTGPARSELRAAARALEMGEETELVIERLAARAGHAAYDAIAAAILLQREAGGDLAGLLRRIAGTLEEAARVEADARSLTAQARFTALLVAVLPAGAALLAELGRPGYLASLFSSAITAWLAGFSFVLQAASWVAIRRIARVRT
jgi:tight adherence protein B